MAHQDTTQPTTQPNIAAFLAAFVANRAAAAAALEAWRRGAALAKQQERAHLAMADYWAGQRMKYEARAAEILEQYPELNVQEQEDSHDEIG